MIDRLTPLNEPRRQRKGDRKEMSICQVVEAQTLWKLMTQF